MSAPLFTEDRYSSSSEDDLAVCDAEITQINTQNQLSQAFTHNSTRGRPTSTPTTMDYMTQGDPNQVAPPTPINTLVQAKTQNQFLGTNNFSFQMVATDASMRSRIRFSMPDTWRMETIHTS